MPHVLDGKAKWDENSAEYQGHQGGRAPTCPTSCGPGSRRSSLDAYRALRVRDYGRVDLRLTETGEIYVIEVNASCYLEQTSEFAAAAAAAGIDYPTLINRIAELAAGTPTPLKGAYWRGTGETSRRPSGKIEGPIGSEVPCSIAAARRVLGRLARRHRPCHPKGPTRRRSRALRPSPPPVPGAGAVAVRARQPRRSTTRPANWPSRCRPRAGSRWPGWHAGSFECSAPRRTRLVPRRAPGPILDRRPPPRRPCAGPRGVGSRECLGGRVRGRVPPPSPRRPVSLVPGPRPAVARPEGLDRWFGTFVDIDVRTRDEGAAIYRRIVEEAHEGSGCSTRTSAPPSSIPRWPRCSATSRPRCSGDRPGTSPFARTGPRAIAAGRVASRATRAEASSASGARTARNSRPRPRPARSSTPTAGSRRLGTFIDVTARNAPRRPCASEGRFRALMEQAPFSVQVFDPEAGPCP